ncbi:N-acetylmuramoyl-L-alanine amidase [bacterium]|nr:N-acetylmuramoyl-L-alanine amidase [bacterium]
MMGLISGCVTPEIETVTEPPSEMIPVAEGNAEETVAAPEPPIIPAVVVPGSRVVRHGDEIVVAGQLFRTGNPVVLWMDEDGYDGYRVERRYSALAEADWKSSQSANRALTTPNRYSLRSATLTAAEREDHRSGNWSLSELQEVVDQLILHYDVSGTSRQCFERLHDHRGLSIHFMVDVDGTIYQTLDLKEKAWHATLANSRSIGIEIAHMGAYPDPEHAVLKRWYAEADDAGAKLTIPSEAHPDSVRNADYSARPARGEMISGEINGQQLWQYDFTEEQYSALAHLAAALHVVFPKMALDYPRDEKGELLLNTFSKPEWEQFSGLLGHYHVQTNKIDPGPATQWDRIVREARALLGETESTASALDPGGK